MAGSSRSVAGAALALRGYALAQSYRSLKQSSYDRTGGNADRWAIEPGETHDVFAANGPGVITHIWFTISAQSGQHLKELVLRMYWDGASKPSVESPVGDDAKVLAGSAFASFKLPVHASAITAETAYRAVGRIRSV